MFIRAARPIKKGEELCISYTALDKTFEEKEEIFAHWTGPNDGFTCMCDDCNIYRSNSEAKNLAAEVSSAYNKAAELVTFRSIRMAEASEIVMPQRRRDEIIEFFQGQDIPMASQLCLSKLYVMEGTYVKSKGDHDGALEAFTKALKIGYASRGSMGLEYLKDMWRIVGASMACKDRDKAQSYLSKVWHSRGFKCLPPSDAKKAFVDLTIYYSMPWWVDEPDYGRQSMMERLARDVAGKAGKKKGNRRK